MFCIKINVRMVETTRDVYPLLDNGMQFRALNI